AIPDVQVIEIPDDNSAPPRSKRAKRARSDAKGAVRVTAMTYCSKVVTLTTVPRCWDIPSPEDGTIAYLLDLRDDKREWKEDDGTPMSMAKIIKSQDQDAWASGTAGADNKTSKIFAFDPDNKTPVMCRRAHHYCQGIYHCSELDMSILDNCRRYAADRNERGEVWKRQLRMNEMTCPKGAAISFYHDMSQHQCPHSEADGQPCNGLAVIRQFKSKESLDGKTHFIGCSKWSRNEAKSHRIIWIPIQINEDLVIKLFQNNGHLPEAALSDVIPSGECAYITTRASGGRGARLCRYPHINVADSKAVQGSLRQRQCDAQIKIYYPVDRTDRRAIVMVEGPHNHPMPFEWKVSYDAKVAYRAAAEEVGPMGLTRSKLNMAPSTQKMLGGGSTPASLDPALANPRHQRRILNQVKREKMPFGNGMEGVLALRHADLKNLPKSDQYIHEVRSEYGFNIIVTALPALVAHYHEAFASLHDNTYKRVHGQWKEWEVVIWVQRLNMRLTLARVYCENETRDAFREMWLALWRTIENVSGKPVRFKFIHGSGLRAILVDGCKAQIQGLGDALLLYSRECTINPSVIVQYILKTCSVHLDRGFTALSAHLPTEDMMRVRQCKFIETQAELDDWRRFCENSRFKKLRGLEFRLQQHFFLCVSAMLMYVFSARKLDVAQAEKLRLAEDGYLPNHRNTDAHRAHSSRLR
ncbi:hypothetical protein FA95DRAFT_1640147, partial [Auriscalpium vulgare]